MEKERFVIQVPEETLTDLRERLVEDIRAFFRSLR